MTQRYDKFRNELTHLINKYSLENYSDTPDFILADYLVQCFIDFNQSIRAREVWYGRNKPENITENLNE